MRSFLKPPQGGWRLVLFCGCIGFSVSTLLWAVGGGPWWLPGVPLAGIVACCDRRKASRRTT